MRAPALSRNGVIGICSPSHIPQKEDYAVIFEAIRRKGYCVREADNLYKDTYGYLASPEERAADFNQLVADPEVELILFGGGEGANELLPYIDFENIRQHPKRICSYSDGTTVLNAIWANTGLETYYGQGIGAFRDLRCYDYEHFLHHLVLDDMAVHEANSVWRVMNPGRAEGILLGGYVRNFAMQLSSRYFPVDLTKKYVLFIEDHKMFGGIDYVSAMLSHIEQSDFMHSVTGLIFGHYDTELHPELLSRLKRFGERYAIPVVYCDDFGHGVNHAILPVGRRAELDTEHCTLRYFL